MIKICSIFQEDITQFDVSYDYLHIKQILIFQEIVSSYSFIISRVIYQIRRLIYFQLRFLLHMLFKDSNGGQFYIPNCL